MDKESIRKESKEMLDSFAKALEAVEKEKDVDSYVDREEFERKERDGKDSNPGFKKRLLENAPKKDNNSIITERGSWK
jgi:predicted Asp-tRNA(Asn)/Glu-tRNA(Gln) amidotransferase subunit C